MNDTQNTPNDVTPGSLKEELKTMETKPTESTEPKLEKTIEIKEPKFTFFKPLNELSGKN